MAIHARFGITRSLSLVAAVLLSATTAASAQSPVVTLAQPNDQRQLDACASCASFTTAYSTPTFGFNGGSVGTSLYYSTELARPTAYVEVNVQFPGAQRPTRIRIRSWSYQTSAWKTLTTGVDTAFVRGDTTALRIAAQLADSTLATGVYLGKLEIKAFYGDSSAPSSSSTVNVDSVRFLVQNESASPYGRGWTVAGDPRIHVQGNGDALLADGLGGLAYYKQVSCTGSPNTCSFTSPTGDYGTLIRVTTDATNQWRRAGRAGDTTTWTSTGLLNYSRDRWGNKFEIERMGSGDATRVYRMKVSTRLNGSTITKTTTFAYDGSGKLASITLPDDRLSTFTVDASGNLTVGNDPDGSTAFRMTYTNGRIIGLSGRSADTTSVVYDNFGQVSHLISPRVTIDGGATVRDTTLSWSQRRRLLEGQTATAVAATVNADLRDSTLLRVTDALGTTVTTWADTAGAPVRVLARSATGTVTQSTFTYDASYRLTASVVDNAETRFTWDGPLLSTVLKLQPNLGFNDSTAYWYTTFDQLDSVRVNGTKRAQYFYSGARLAPYSIQADSGVVTDFTYDSAGRALTIKDRGNNRTVTTTYEATHANPSSVVRTATSVTSATVSYSYDGSGRVVSVTDPASRVFATKYDSLNRVVRTIGPISDTTRFIARAATRTDTLFDAKGQRYVTVRNARGLVTQQVDPRGKSDYFWYDRLGRLVKSQNRRGDSVRVEYDGYDRVTRRLAWTAGGVLDTARFAYDTVAGLWVMGLNAESRDSLTRYPEGRPLVTTSIRGTRAFKMTYGYTDSTWSWTRWIEGDSILANGSWTLKWKDTSVTKQTVYHRTYALTDYGGQEATIAPDAYGRPITTTLPTSTSPTNKVKETTTYTWDDRPLTVAYTGANIGTTQNRTYANYDALGRIGSVWTAATANPRRWHTYDTGGRLSGYEDVKDSLQIVGWDYEWDELHQEWDSVPAWDYVGVTVRSATYTYDQLANRTDHSASLDSANRLLAFDGWTITSDDAGYMTQRTKGAETLTYTWNAHGQLTQVTAPGSTTTYGYDAFGNRIRKTVNGVATRYLVEHGQVVVELDTAWQVAAKYTYYPGVDRPQAMVRAGKRYYFLQDAQANVVAVTDSVGTIKNTYAYTPYGEAISAGTSETVTTPFRYKGREWEAEARLVFMRARYYDPLLGRFISEDPIGLAGGVNPTAFVSSDPVNRADPSGLRTCEPWVAWRREFGEIVVYDRWMVCDEDDGGRGGGGGGGGIAATGDEEPRKAERRAAVGACISRNTEWMRSDNFIIAGAIGGLGSVGSGLGGILGQAAGREQILRGAVDLDMFFGTRGASSSLVEGGISQINRGRQLLATGRGLVRGGLVTLAVQGTFVLSYVATTGVLCNANPNR